MDKDDEEEEEIRVVPGAGTLLTDETVIVPKHKKRRRNLTVKTCKVKVKELTEELLLASCEPDTPP